MQFVLCWENCKQALVDQTLWHILMPWDGQALGSIELHWPSDSNVTVVLAGAENPAQSSHLLWCSFNCHTNTQTLNRQAVHLIYTLSWALTDRFSKTCEFGNWIFCCYLYEAVTLNLKHLCTARELPCFQEKTKTVLAHCKGQSLAGIFSSWV